MDFFLELIRMMTDPHQKGEFFRPEISWVQNMECSPTQNRNGGGGAGRSGLGFKPQSFIFAKTCNRTVKPRLDFNQSPSLGRVYLILIHIFSNSHQTPIPNTCIKFFFWSKLPLGKFLHFTPNYSSLDVLIKLFLEKEKCVVCLVK